MRGWRDNSRLWQRYADAPPEQQELLRLMYQAGLEDGGELAYQQAQDDPAISLVIQGHLVEVQRGARRALADAGQLDYTAEP